MHYTTEQKAALEHARLMLDHMPLCTCDVCSEANSARYSKTPGQALADDCACDACEASRDAKEAREIAEAKALGVKIDAAKPAAPAMRAKSPALVVYQDGGQFYSVADSSLVANYGDEFNWAAAVAMRERFIAEHPHARLATGADMDDMDARNARIERETAARESLEMTKSAKVESLPAGEYVKRKHDARKVYKRGAYDRSQKRYELHDESDISRSIFVKRGTILFYDFTY